VRGGGFSANDDTMAESSAPFAPRSLADLFWSFSVLALQGFGGVAAVAQREIVERRRWMTREEFLEEWAVAQILPGPNIVNLSIIIGQRHFGVRGAVVALAGMLSLPLVIVLGMTILYATVQDHPVARGVLRGMGAVAAGLILGTALKMIVALKGNVMGPAVCAVVALAGFVGFTVLGLPLIVVILAVGLSAMAWAYRQLGRHAGPGPAASATDAPERSSP